MNRRSWSAPKLNAGCAFRLRLLLTDMKDTSTTLADEALVGRYINVLNFCVRTHSPSTDHPVLLTAKDIQWLA